MVKWKSRLVILGCSQIEGIDFTETFAPEAKATTFRLMVALAHVLQLHVNQLLGTTPVERYICDKLAELPNPGQA